MANIVIKGVYTSKSALDTAEKATASAGDTYIVGSKIPYDLYTFASGEFKKGDAVSNVVGDLTTPVTIDDVTADTDISKLFTFTFKKNGENVRIRETVGRIRHDTYEIYGV